jgi:hypothetical protein
MSEICCGESDRLTMRQKPAERGAADWLALAASPTFAVMALLTTVWGGGPAELLCAAVSGSALSGMTAMYLLMGVFHAGPWLKLIRARPS